MKKKPHHRRQQAELNALTFKELKADFAAKLDHYPYAATEVQAYLTDFHSAQIKNLLGEKFERNFHLNLSSYLIELKNSARLDPTRWHAFLCAKYLGINLDAPPNTEQALPIKPSAYYSEPSLQSEDFSLHQGFVQPYLVFGITAENRKYITWKKNSQRKWYWKNPYYEADVAPLLRRIMQVYILDDILQDYANAQKKFFNPKIKRHLPKLKRYRQALLSEINHNAENVLRHLNAQTPDPSFWQHLNKFTQADMDQIKPLFALWRSCTGNYLMEPHILQARRMLPHPNTENTGQLISWWMISHLHLQISRWWWQKMVKGYQRIFRLLTNISRNALTAENYFRELRQIQQEAYWLVAAPMWMLLPPLLGLASLPFTLVKTWYTFWLSMVQDEQELTEPTQQYLQDIMAIDIAESLKDLFLVLGVIFPFLRISSFCALNYMMQAPMSWQIWWALMQNLAQNVLSFETLALPQLFQSVNFVIVSYSIAYTTFALLLLAAIALAASYGWIQRYRFPDKFSHPMQQQLPRIEFPLQAEKTLAFATKAQITALLAALYKLNQSLNFRPNLERKVIVTLIEALQDPSKLSAKKLQQVLAQAQEIVGQNFSPQDAEQMKKMVEALVVPEKENALKQAELAGLKVQGSQGSYQPSQWLLEQLQTQKDPTPADPIILSKCPALLWSNRIKGQTKTQKRSEPVRTYALRKRLL